MTTIKQVTCPSNYFSKWIIYDNHSMKFVTKFLNIFKVKHINWIKVLSKKKFISCLVVLRERQISLWKASKLQSFGIGNFSCNFLCTVTLCEIMRKKCHELGIHIKTFDSHEKSIRNRYYCVEKVCWMDQVLCTESNENLINILRQSSIETCSFPEHFSVTHILVWWKGMGDWLFFWFC